MRQRQHFGPLYCLRVLLMVGGAGLLALGCVDGGGGAGSTGSGTTPFAVGGGAASGGSATNAPQWQTAMAALAQAPASGDPTYFIPSSLSAYNAVIARAWRRLLPRVRAEIDTLLATRLVGASGGQIAIQGVRNVDLSIDSAPALYATSPGPLQTVTLAMPAPPARWRLRATVDVGGTISYRLFGRWISSPVSLAVDIDVFDIAITQAVDVDLTRPGDPVFAAARNPDLRLQLNLSSPSPILSTIVPVLAGILDPVIRVALVAAAGVVQREVGLQLQGLPTSFAWGRGGPALPPVSNPPALEPLTLDYLATVRRDLLPFGMVYSAMYDDPTPGQGVIVGYHDHGDSPLWTGHYVTAEAYRYDLTGDPTALAGATRALEGFATCLQVTSHPGLLARAAIPLSSPYAAEIQNGTDPFVGVYNGVAYQGIGNISRDQYIGMFLGLGQTMLRLPSLRQKAGALAAMAVDYLEANDWVAYRVSRPSEFTVLFLQSPGSLVSFTKIAALYDPGRYGALAQSYEPLAELMWLGNWLSSREVHESYYKFNLAHATHLSLFELEVDPTLYRAYIRSHRTLRPVIAHHWNGWFDTVHAIAVPTAAARFAPSIQNILEHAALRPRRGFYAQNSLDPNVQLATYTATSPANGGAPGGQIQTGPRTITVTVLPLPPEKRPPSNYFWQRSPFQPDGGVTPLREYAGTELALPYWAARSHGILP